MKTKKLWFNQCKTYFGELIEGARHWLDKTTCLEYKKGIPDSQDPHFIIWFHTTDMARVFQDKIHLTPQGHFDRSTLRRYKKFFGVEFRRYMPDQWAYELPNRLLHPLINKVGSPASQVMINSRTGEPIYHPEMEAMGLFTKGFIDCALWSEGLDKEYEWTDLGVQDVLHMWTECRMFEKENQEALQQYYNKVTYSEGTPQEYAGHDFWLTRNGHGAGFWSRAEIDNSVSDLLTSKSKEFTQCSIVKPDSLTGCLSFLS